MRACCMHTGSVHACCSLRGLGTCPLVLPVVQIVGTPREAVEMGLAAPHPLQCTVHKWGLRWKEYRTMTSTRRHRGWRTRVHWFVLSSSFSLLLRHRGAENAQESSPDRSEMGPQPHLRSSCHQTCHNPTFGLRATRRAPQRHLYSVVLGSVDDKCRGI
jgi:hypothetical protein